VRQGFRALKLLEHETVKPKTRRNASIGFDSALLILVLATGCGAPGEPRPATPPVPVAITDLTAHQAGESVELAFTLPTKTISGDPLAKPPAIEVLRGASKPDGSLDAKSFRVVTTIPGALVADNRSEDGLQILVPIAAEELRGHPGDTFLFRVRTRAARKRASPDSNTVSVRMFPVAERIRSLEARVTETAVELIWQAPTRTSAGDTLQAIAEYRVYRGELDPASAEAAAKDISQAKWKSPLAQLAASPRNAYRDVLFDFGKTYLYVVRTVIPSDTSGAVESSDSAPTVVTPGDIFAPAVPLGLVAAVIVGSPTNAPEAELSWSINLETDLAGYRVYRSEQEGTPGQLVTPDLLLSPAYRDTSVQPGHRYWYSVTSVDRSGNESAPSAPVAAEITQPSS